MVEVVGNGTYGQVYKVGWRRSAWPVLFSQCSMFFFFFAPLIKPGNNGSDSEKTRLSQMLPSDHTTRKRKWGDCNGVSGDSSLFWSQSDQGVIQQGG